MSATDTASGTRKLALTIGALGVVFGDIGTSPLYALKECLHHSGDVNRATTLGILSLILWSLIVIVSIKYVTLVLRADNHGEGGILALLNLAFPANVTGPVTKSVMLMGAIGVFGAALLYGDGVITPAISVVSAVEGLEVISPALSSAVVPISVCILIALFSVQRFGTNLIGKAFGPIILFWFLVIGTLGAVNVFQHSEVLEAFNPLLGFKYLIHHPKISVVVLGSVVLAVTGAETMYADMGHFGRIPIRTAWNFIVLPALMLNYLGQGALVISTSWTEDMNPFFQLAPDWATLPLVLLATAAGVIASQGLISGVFSLTTAAMQMGYLPRMQIAHTSHETSGRIYVPVINFALAVACITLVLSFQSSTKLAAAYGIAVTMTMMATTGLFYVVTQRHWGWSRPLSLAVCSVFGLIEVAFFASNLLKVPHGGWLPLFIGTVIFYLMTTWKIGRTYIRSHVGDAMTLPCFVDSIAMSGILDSSLSPHRVKGTAIFLASTPDITPHSLSYNLTHNHILHERNIILTISPARVPVVEDDQKLNIVELPEGFYQITARFGFMEVPTIQAVVDQAAAKGMDISLDKSTFFLGRETLVRGNKGLPRWREAAFVMMSKNAQNAAQFFRLPSSRTIEIGKQVEI